jgi:uncharacterized protein (DUF433 family)
MQRCRLLPAVPRTRLAAGDSGASRSTICGEKPVNYTDRIVIEPGKRAGRPVIRGLRITVYDVLGWLSDGMSPEEIIEDFPELERQDIQACLAYAADRERMAVTVAGD